MHSAYTQYARTLRKQATNAEKLLWHYLRAKQLGGLKFRRQQPIGKYIVDFICFSHKLVIELDGGQHAQPSNQRRDQQRDTWLQEQGFKVLRFWNNDVVNNIEGVVETIHYEIFGVGFSPSPDPNTIDSRKSPSPNPSHQGRGTVCGGPAK